jgi:hypothetical protein
VPKNIVINDARLSSTAIVKKADGSYVMSATVSFLDDAGTVYYEKYIEKPITNQTIISKMDTAFDSLLTQAKTEEGV